MKSKPKPPRTEAAYQRAANREARAFVMVKPCRECKWPVIDGYCCNTCGSVDP